MTAQRRGCFLLTPQVHKVLAVARGGSERWGSDVLRNMAALRAHSAKGTFSRYLLDSTVEPHWHLQNFPHTCPPPEAPMSVMVSLLDSP